MLAKSATDEKSVLRQYVARMSAACVLTPAAEPLLKSPVFRDAAAVALYVAIPGEVDTDPLLAASWGTGKEVYLPRITDRATCSMEFLRCKNSSELRRGSFGLLEPVCGTVASRVDLLIVPGLAFDRRGYRLGHGHGFYDRFLANHPNFTPMAIGLCCSWQVLDHLPADPWDLPMQALCTEEGLQWL